MLNVAGWVLGTLFSAVHMAGPQLLGPGNAPTVVWMEQNAGWELSAFGAFGAMSGFALAALALVASVSGHARASEIIDANPGRYMLRSLVNSVWAWLVAALAALAAIVFHSTIVEALVLFTATVASARAVIALVALTLFFKRFTVDKPE